MSQFVKTTSISLSATEEKIFQVLRETVAYKNRSTVLRVAGGWVRDKVRDAVTVVCVLLNPL
jgi:hypothetical protein